MFFILDATREYTWLFIVFAIIVILSGLLL